MVGGMKLLPCLLYVIVGGGTANFVFAQKPPSLPVMADPTRPPAELTAPVADSVAGADGKPVAASGGLQAVILRKGAKPMAVINGDVVSLGGKIGDARLVKISETEAELDGPNGKEVMRMMPTVDKKISRKPKVVSNIIRSRSKHESH